MAGLIQVKEGKFRVTISDGFKADGKRKLVTKTFTATSWEEAREKAKEMEVTYKQGVTTQFDRDTVADLIDLYIKKHLATDGNSYGLYKSISTISKDKNTLLDIKDKLGGYKICDLDSVKVDNYIHSLSQNGARRDGKKGGLSAKTIKNRLHLLSAVCAFGVKQKILSENPCIGVELPRMKRKEVKYYTKSEVNALLKGLEDADIKHRTAIYIDLTCGLRKAELMALEWGDIDFEKATITISRGSQYISKVGIVETDLKTDGSYRTISVPDSLVTMLKEYKAWQDEQKRKAGAAWRNSDRLFVNKYGKPLHPDSMYQWFDRFLERKGLPHMSLHGLRHTSISLLIFNKVDIAKVSKRAGHSNIYTTLNTYTHLFEEVDKTSADIFEKSLF